MAGKPPSKRPLGDLEQLILLAVARFDGDGYAVNIRDEIEERTGRRCSLGAVYTTLDRLEEKGYASSTMGEPTAERGGRSKRFFRLEDAGARALVIARRRLDRMWEGLDPARLGGAPLDPARLDPKPEAS